MAGREAKKEIKVLLDNGNNKECIGASYSSCSCPVSEPTFEDAPRYRIYKNVHLFNRNKLLDTQHSRQAIEILQVIVGISPLI